MASSNNPTDLDDQLISFEKLDRSSPDLWPENLNNISDFMSLLRSPMSPASPAKWMSELEKDDIDLLQEFGSLTTANLLEKVRDLQNHAYQLGLEESKEMTRGKFLNILSGGN